MTQHLSRLERTYLGMAEAKTLQAVSWGQEKVLDGLTAKALLCKSDSVSNGYDITAAGVRALRS